MPSSERPARMGMATNPQLPTANAVITRMRAILHLGLRQVAQTATASAITHGIANGQPGSPLM